MSLLYLLLQRLNCYYGNLVMILSLVLVLILFLSQLHRHKLCQNSIGIPYPNRQVNIKSDLTLMVLTRCIPKGYGRVKLDSLSNVSNSVVPNGVATNLWKHITIVFTTNIVQTYTFNVSFVGDLFTGIERIIMLWSGGLNLF
jgi:hypothetical protein